MILVMKAVEGVVFPLIFKRRKSSPVTIWQVSRRLPPIILIDVRWGGKSIWGLTEVNNIKTLESLARRAHFFFFFAVSFSSLQSVKRLPCISSKSIHSHLFLSFFLFCFFFLSLGSVCGDTPTACWVTV